MTNIIIEKRLIDGYEEVLEDISRKTMDEKKLDDVLLTKVVGDDIINDFVQWTGDLKQEIQIVELRNRIEVLEDKVDKLQMDQTETGFLWKDVSQVNIFILDSEMPHFAIQRARPIYYTSSDNPIGLLFQEAMDCYQSILSNNIVIRSPVICQKNANEVRTVPRTWTNPIGQTYPIEPFYKIHSEMLAAELITLTKKDNVPNRVFRITLRMCCKTDVIGSFFFMRLKPETLITIDENYIEGSSFDYTFLWLSGEKVLNSSVISGYVTTITDVKFAIEAGTNRLMAMFNLIIDLVVPPEATGYRVTNPNWGEVYYCGKDIFEKYKDFIKEWEKEHGSYTPVIITKDYVLGNDGFYILPPLHFQVYDLPISINIAMIQSLGPASGFRTPITWDSFNLKMDTRFTQIENDITTLKADVIQMKLMLEVLTNEWIKRRENEESVIDDWWAMIKEEPVGQNYANKVYSFTKKCLGGLVDLLGKVTEQIPYVVDLCLKAW